MISSKLKKRIFTALILFLLYLIIFNYNIFFAYALIILGIISILEFFNITKKITKSRFTFLAINIVFINYIFLFCLIAFYFINFIETKILFFTLILACISSDIGGFIFGNILKGPKLTKISPNKTISGSFGSIIFSNIFFPTSVYLFTDNFSYTLFVVATITSIFCQLGDLFFSFMKRKAKIKDTGNFLPGHGGVLDRLDGIYLGVPIGFISVIFLY